MKIEAGRYYLDRSGEAHGPIRMRSQRAYADVWTDYKYSWGADGRYFGKHTDSKLDLVAEVTPLPPSPVGQGCSPVGYASFLETAAPEPLLYPRVVEEDGRTLLKIKYGDTDIVCPLSDGQIRNLTRELVLIAFHHPERHE